MDGHDGVKFAGSPYAGREGSSTVKKYCTLACDHAAGGTGVDGDVIGLDSP
jgi:hypothetical protein